MSSGVRNALDAAIYRAAVRPVYGVGFLVGSVASSVALILLGNRWSATDKKEMHR